MSVPSSPTGRFSGFACATWVAGILLGGLPASGLPQPAALPVPQGDPAGRGVHFEIQADFLPALSRAEALEAAEAALPVLLAELGRTELTLPRPIPIRLYADRSRFRAATQAANPESEAMGFSQRVPLEGHVGLEPPWSSSSAPELPADTLRLVAHEATHLACFALFANSFDHPGWFVEGLASAVAARTLQRLGCGDERERDPFSASQILLVQELERSNQLPRAGSILADRVGDLDFYQRHALRWLFYEFLREQRAPELGRLVGVLRELQGGFERGARIQRRLAEVWAPSAEQRPAALQALDGEFVRWLRALEPRWRRVLGRVESRGGVLLQCAVGRDDAVLEGSRPVEDLPFRCRGSLCILPGRTQQLHLLLGRGEPGFLSVCFTAGWGVSVLEYDARAARWTQLAAVELSTLVPGRETEFEVRASAGRLEVSLGGTPALSAPLRDCSALGRWGLGTQAGSRGTWRDVEVAGSAPIGAPPASAR